MEYGNVWFISHCRRAIVHKENGETEVVQQRVGDGGGKDGEGHGSDGDGSGSDGDGDGDGDGNDGEPSMSWGAQKRRRSGNGREDTGCSTERKKAQGSVIDLAQDIAGTNQLPSTPNSNKKQKLAQEAAQEDEIRAHMSESPQFPRLGHGSQSGSRPKVSGATGSPAQRKHDDNDES